MSMSVDNVHSLFEPDPEVIRAHLERLFRRVPTEYPGGLIEIAWAETTGAVNHGELFETTPEGLDRAAEAAVSRNLERRNVYVGVNPRKPGSPSRRGRTEDIEIAFFQFAECDKPDSVELLKQAPLPYTMTVVTGRTPNPRPHAYWELAEPTRNMASWHAQQTALRDHFNGDAVLDPPRILRLAGTVNYPAAHKVRRGYRTEIVTLHTLYNGQKLAPVTQEALAAVYRPNGWGTKERFDPETGEVFEDASEASLGPRERPIFDTGGLSFRELIERIEANNEWNTHLFRLIGRMVRQGYPDALIMAIGRSITIQGYTEQQTSREISEMLLRTRKNFNVPNKDEPLNDEPDQPLTIIPLGVLKPANRAPRDWLVPFRMMRRHITMTTAAPGVGKSTLAIEEAVSQASGIDFLDFGIKEPRRVAIINNEETRDELERRIEATCTHFEVPFESIAENLFLYSGVDASKVIMARLDRNGNVIPTVHASALRELVNDLKIDEVILDPFVQLHYVTESSNEEISRTLVAMRSIGLSDYPAAIHVIHHNRKPVAGNSHQAGDMSSARGASSMGGEAHMFFTLTDMGDADGEKLNVEEDDRSLYIRLDDAKGKMAPPQSARWFQREGVMMPYGLMGEEIGVLVPHDMEDVLEVTKDSATQMLKVVQEAWNSGNPYSEFTQSGPRHVVRAMMKNMRMTRTTAQHLLKDWIGNGIVMTDILDKHRNLKGLRVVKWPG